MTKMRPRKAGIDPITRPPATIKPQTAIGPGFAATARSDVRTAVWSPTVPVEQQRKRHHADRQHQQSEEETNAHPHYDHRPARARGEYVAGGSGPRVSW
jgi:hypothetical protein